MVGDDDVKFATLFEDVMVDVLRRIRSGVERKNGDFRRFVFECASQTLRRRHGWVFVAKPTTKPLRATLRDLSRMRQPEPHEAAAAMAGLGAEERELLVLRHRFGFSYDDISEIRSEARVNFEERLQSAREQFRYRLMEVMNAGSPRAAADETPVAVHAGAVAK
jgi:DNA-directed RNA polymerase specialized sigma24 family protein